MPKWCAIHPFPTHFFDSMTQKFWNFLYTWLLLPALLVLSRLLALKNAKIKNSLAGRVGLWSRLEAQIIHRDIHKPLLWFHVASVGEYLQAEPVIERCLQAGLEGAVTFSSISGYNWAKRTQSSGQMNLVVVEYLPVDFPRNIRRILAILQPALLVHVKFDLWPNLIWKAHAAGVPQFLLSATLQPHSLRVTSALGRSFYGTIYACLDGIFAVTEAHAQRFRRTNPSHPNIQTVGDTRYDSVLDRKQRLSPPQLPAGIEEKFVFIAGSSWPPDEALIFPALEAALQEFPDFLVMIAPHEPTEAHLAHGETFFKAWQPQRLTQLNANSSQLPRVILVDVVGVLSSLYQAGHLAYVGGAFTSGVHNVMEPCVMGMPVVFGPLYENSAEAIELLAQGVAFTFKETEGFHKILFRLLHDRSQCARLGKQATQMIESSAGVADQCFDLIQEKIQ